MMEGVHAAPGYLQFYMNKFFSSIEENSVVIMDNILIGYNTDEEGIALLKKVVAICAHHNVILKMAKTHLGEEKVKFFGYYISKGVYEIGPERIEALQAMPMPDSIKGMQRFLGACLFLAHFIPNYSVHAAPLYEMTNKSFSFNESTWTSNYRECFQRFKEQLVKAVTLFFPNYDWEWICGTDGSNLGCASIIWQIPPWATSKYEWQVIFCLSHKWSGPAKRWDIIHKELFPIVMTCKKLSYYLLGKEFTVETDHRNLLFLDFTEVPKLIRWRLFLQTFAIKWRSIKGKDAVLPDMISRLFRMVEAQLDHDNFVPSIASLSSSDPVSTPPPLMIHEPDELAEEQEEEDPLIITPVADNIRELDNENNRQKAGYPRSRLELLQLAHGGLNFHHGTRRIWAYLNKYYPGHRIPYDAVQEFVQTCPICQKNRLALTAQNTLEPIIRSHFREGGALLCSDYLYLEGPTALGNNGCHVILDYYTKLCAVYPGSGPTAWNLSQALITHLARYGYQDALISDQGTDYVAEATEQVTKWLNMKHTLSLVNAHSNGTERANREILRHIRTLLQDDPIVIKEPNSNANIEWDNPVFQAALHIVLNGEVSAETGHTPQELTFGVEGAKNYSLLTKGQNYNPTEYLRVLGTSLSRLRTKSYAYMAKRSTERKEKTVPHLQNLYMPGDYVLRELDKPLPNKVNPPMQGPYKVILQTANDVQVENIVTGEFKSFPVTVLKLFFGDSAAAYEAAKIDQKQHDIEVIRAAKGPTDTRSKMWFQIVFQDGDVRWLPYSKDIDQTVHYETLCRTRHDLWPLLYTTTVLKEELKRLKQPITMFNHFPTTIYVDLRAFGDSKWYDSLNLPDGHGSIFVFECEVSNFADAHTKKQVRLFYPLIELRESVNNVWLHTWGRYPNLQPTLQLIDANFATTYPQILEPRSRTRLVRKWKSMI